MTPQQPAEPRSLKRVLAVGAKLLASLLVAAVVLEVGLRVFPGAIPTKVLFCYEPGLRLSIAQGRYATREDTEVVPRDDGGPTLRKWKPFFVNKYRIDDPGAVRAVRVDEQGFSNPPGVWDATPTLDIIAVGDSFTFAHAVGPEDAWAHRIGALTGCSSYNLGRGGLGPYESIQMLKRFGLPRRPKVVVLNIYEGNDIRDACRYHECLGGADAERLEQESWQKNIVAKNSYAYNFVCATWSYLARRSALKRAEASIDYAFRVGPVVFNELQTSRDEVVYAQRVKRGEIGFELFDRALASFVALGTEHGFIPVVAYTPAAAAVYEQAEFNEPWVKDLLLWFSGEQRRFFEAKAAELGFTFVDLTPALQAAVGEIDPQTLLYYPSTIHYTARGHEVVADRLAAALHKLGIRPP